MKYIILLLTATAILSFARSTKEPLIYIGHAQIINENKDEWCVVRLIHSTSQKKADSLFRPLVDSLEKCYLGKSDKKLYIVYKLQPSMILKIKTDE